jgi:site-specific DNA recombinase
MLSQVYQVTHLAEYSCKMRQGKGMTHQDKNTIRYFPYSRKSSEEVDRQVLSIQAQQDEIGKKFPDLEMVEYLSESASAHQPYNRPVFTSMLERIKNGEAQGIIAWHPDRLSRNPIDAAQILYFLDKGIIQDLKFTSFSFENSPEGKMMLGMMLTQSKYFSDKLSKDIKRGNRAKLKTGHLPGKAKAGYINVRLPDGQKVVQPDEPRFSLLKQAWGLLLQATYSVAEIHHKLVDEWGYRNAKGIPMSKSKLYEVFTDEFYSGWINRVEGRFRGKHAPMITETEFDRAQEILGTRGRPKPKKHRYPFSGLIRCGECAGVISPDTKTHCYCQDCKRKFVITKARKHCPLCNKSIFAKGMKLLDFPYYRCAHHKQGTKCHQKAIRMEELDRQIEQYLNTIKLPSSLTTWVIKWLKLQHQKETEEHTAQLQALHTASEQCQKKLDNLVDMRLNDMIDNDGYKARQLLINREKEGIAERINGFEHRITQWVELTEKTLSFATLAPQKFATGTLEERRQILATLGANLTLRDGKLSIQPKKPFRLIQEAKEILPAADTLSVPKIMDDISTENVVSSAPISVLCWGQDSNLRSLTARVLQTRVFDHSTTPAFHNSP